MQPFKAKKGSPERGRIWNLIAESLNHKPSEQQHNALLALSQQQQQQNQMLLALIQKLVSK